MILTEPNELLHLSADVFAFDHVVFALLNLKFHLDDDGAMGNPVITDFAECKLQGSFQ